VLEVLVKKKKSGFNYWALGQYIYPRLIYVHARKARINGIICSATKIPRIEKFLPAAADVAAQQCGKESWR
jgi:hypothetical protein